MTLLRDLWNYDRNVNSARYGIEVEVEGGPWPDAPTNWDAKGDGSLDETGVEFVTRQAFGPDKFGLMLGRLDDAFNDAGTELDCGIGCSVHVHMNVQDLTPAQILSIMAAYYIVEDLMVEYAGPNRAGNLFCLRASDAEEPIWAVVNAVNNNEFPSALHNDDLKYSALNVASLRRFGTLEFRSYGALSETPMEVLPWLNMVHRLREFALGFQTPQQVVSEFSMIGPSEFLKSVFGPELSELLPFNAQAMRDGMRRAQWLAFRSDLSKVQVRQRGPGLFPLNQI